MKGSNWANSEKNEVTLSRTIDEDELRGVLSHYAIGSLIAPPESGGGTANANMTLRTASGRWFLKRRNPKYAQRNFVAFDHRLMEHLAPFGVGTPLAVRTRQGERWLELGGAVYELFPYQPGGPHDRHSLTQLASAGRRLAAFHQAVESFRPPPGKEWPRYQNPRLIREGISAIEADLRKRLSSGDFDYLMTQVARLEREFPDARYHALPKLVVHGDYHPGNLKFLNDEVSGIFDLDWATVQPRVLDLADGIFLFAGERARDIDASDIVSLTQTWMPSIERARVFMEAYLAEGGALRRQHATRSTQHALLLEPEERNVLALLVRARWIYCRVAGMLKVPEERRIDYCVDGLLEPLRALDDRERLY